MHKSFTHLRTFRLKRPPTCGEAWRPDSMLIFGNICFYKWWNLGLNFQFPTCWVPCIIHNVECTLIMNMPCFLFWNSRVFFGCNVFLNPYICWIITCLSINKECNMWHGARSLAWGLCLDFVSSCISILLFVLCGWGLSWVVGVGTSLCTRQSLFWD
jgi:hypothetical protein